jgi:hypothetical protein
MDVADMISDIDDHGFEDSSEERKLAVLNDVYQDVLSREAWPFLEKLDRDTNLTLTGDDSDQLEASEIIRAVLMLRVLSRALEPIRLDTFLEAYGHRADQTGAPWFYYFVGNELHLWPIPATLPDGTTLAYIRGAEDLEADTVEEDILLPREYHRDILVNGALYKLYALEDDAELASGFQRYFEEAIQRMRELAWKKQYQRLPIVEYPSW